MVNAVPFTHQTSVVTRKQFDEHIKLYHGYVDKTNEITQALTASPESASANAVYSHYRALKKGETYAVSGVILHELYFQNLGPGAQANMPGKKMRHLLDRYWGGYDRWREDMTACAKAARGWGLCIYEQRTETCRNIVLDAHDEGNIAAAYPLVALDMYEHAYFIDYAAGKPTYIAKFLDAIPWDEIEKRAAAVVG